MHILLFCRVFNVAMGLHQASDIYIGVCSRMREERKTAEKIEPQIGELARESVRKNLLFMGKKKSAASMRSWQVLSAAVQESHHYVKKLKINNNNNLRIQYFTSVRVSFDRSIFRAQLHSPTTWT